MFYYDLDSVNETIKYLNASLCAGLKLNVGQTQEQHIGTLSISDYRVYKLGFPPSCFVDVVLMSPWVCY